MKKTLLTFISSCLFIFMATAQSPVNFPEKPLIRDEYPVSKPSSTHDLGKAGFTQEWYSVENLFTASTIGTSLTSYVAFLLHDTISKRVNSDGVTSYGYYVGIGHIFDPKDDLIQLCTTQPDPNNSLSRFNNYHIDSLALNYLYVRNADSTDNGAGKVGVVDTLFIAYYKGNQISQGNFASNNINYAALDQKWSFSKRLQTGYFKMDTILLSSGNNGLFDTTLVLNSNGGYENAWRSKIATWAAPAGMNIVVNPNGTTKDNLTGFTLVFKSGILPAVNGDTAFFNYQRDPLTLPANTRRTNYFGFGMQRATSKYAGYKGHNSSQIVYGYSSYGASNGWEGHIATSASTTSETYLKTYFHLQVDSGIPAGMIQVNADIQINQIYPNPTADLAKLSFSLGRPAKNVNVEVMNLIGEVVKTIELGSVNTGMYELSLPVTGLKPGIYMINLNNGKSTSTQKLVITN